MNTIILSKILNEFSRINILSEKNKDFYNDYSYVVLVGSTSAIIETIYFEKKILIFDQDNNFLLCPLSNYKKMKFIDVKKNLEFNLTNNAFKLKKKELNNFLNIDAKQMKLRKFFRNIKN